MLVTSEYRFGTIRPTFLFNAEPLAGARREGRSRACSPGSSSALSARALGLGDRLRDPRRPRHHVRARRRRQSRCSCSARSPAIALWGAIGVGLGTIVRNQVGAIIGLLAWGFVVENLLFAFVPSVGRFAPVHSGRAHRPDHRSSPLARRRRRRAGRLGCRARRRRDRLGRAPRRQLGPYPHEHERRYPARTSRESGLSPEEEAGRHRRRRRRRHPPYTNEPVHGRLHDAGACSAGRRSARGQSGSRG